MLLKYNQSFLNLITFDDAEAMNIEGSRGRGEFVETIASVIAKHAFSRPQRPAIVMTNGRVITYGVLWTQIETFGAAFRVHGFGATSRVAVMLPAPELP